MARAIDRSTFEKAYAAVTPWDIGRPQAPIVAVADRVIGPVLDAGCGTGDTSLFFAARGERVVGIDFVDEPIRRARQKAAERGLPVEFLLKDALTLADWDERFSSVVDSGLFHVFSGEDRKRYVRGLAHVLNPGGRLFLMAGSDRETRIVIPRVSEVDLRDAFAEGWEVESIEPTVYALNPEHEYARLTADQGGALGWFAVVRRAVG